MKFFIPILLVFVFGAVFLFNSRNDSFFYPPLEYSEVGELKGVMLNLAVADTDEKRIAGLSGQTNLEGDQGLLFIFDSADEHGIWMKNMLFSIDVLWLDEDKKVVSIREAFSPESFPEIAYSSTPASFVLELPAGFVMEHEIHIGDNLLFPFRATP